MTERTKRTVLVVGGGYAGVLAANRIAGKAPHLQVKLVTPGETLIDRVRLHEAAARGRAVQTRLDALLHPKVVRVSATLVGLDAARKRAAVDQGSGEEWLAYDALLLSMGSSATAAIPARSRHARALSSVDGAARLYRELKDMRAGTVVVVGGGLTAVELAAELAEAHPRLKVRMITESLALASEPGLQAELRRELARLGVEVHEGARVRELREAAVVLDDGSEVPCDISVLAGGFTPAPVATRLGFLRAHDDRIVVDSYLRVVGHDEIFAVGDVAAVPPSSVGTGLRSARMACASAMPMGAHAADQIVRHFSGAALVPYHFDYLIQCVSLGRRRGLVVFVDADDRPTGRFIGGRKAALIKELLCRFVMATPRLERLFAGWYTWPGRTKSPPLLLPASEQPRP